MSHRSVRRFKAFVATLLAVLLMAVAAITQTLPRSPSWPGKGADIANQRRPSIRDMILSEEPPQRESLKGGSENPPQQKKVHPDRDNLLTIPHWSDTYTYQGLTYNYTMVGTDPKRGSATTTIPTVLIPIRFVFEEDGTVMDPSTDLIDGRTAIQGIVNSPIFQPYGFNVGGISVGDTQFGDAFQRAEFWDSVSRLARLSRDLRSADDRSCI